MSLGQKPWRAFLPAAFFGVVVLAFLTATPATTAPNPITLSPKSTPVISDDFSNPSVSSTIWISSVVGSGPTVVETNHQLQITVPSTSADDPAQGAFGTGYISRCQLRGDFDVQVDYSLLTWPYANGVRVGLITSPVQTLLGNPDATERVSFGSSVDFPGWPRDVYLTNFEDGAGGIASTGDLSGKLRTVRTGSTATGYYFNQGNWIPIHSATVTTADAFFILASWSHAFAFTGQGVSLAFGNFIANQGQLVCPPPPTTISGKVWIDGNRNGSKDVGESTYSNAVVTLSGTSSGATTTDASGSFSFPNLPAGSYTLTLTIPSGYVATTTNPVTVTIGSPPTSTIVNFGIVIPTTLLLPQDYKQDVGSWSSTQLNPPNIACAAYSMAGYGCAVTAAADVLAYYNVPINGSTADPGLLNTWLGAQKGFSGCALNWCAVGGLANAGVGGPIFPTSPSTSNWDQRRGIINAALAANEPAIVSVYPSPQVSDGEHLHFVVITGNVGTPTNPDYVIADPLSFRNDSGKPLSQAKYGSVQDLVNRGYLEVVVIHKPGTGVPCWAAIGHSPIQFIITDPTGTQTGFNPATNTIVQNIPLSTYGAEGGIADALGVGPPIPSTVYFQQSNPPPGSYTAQVVGIATGTYELDFSSTTGSGVTSVQTTAGIVVAGSTTTYTVQLNGSTISLAYHLYLPIVMNNARGS